MLVLCIRVLFVLIRFRIIFFIAQSKSALLYDDIELKIEFIMGFLFI